MTDVTEIENLLKSHIKDDHYYLDDILDRINKDISDINVRTKHNEDNIWDTQAEGRGRVLGLMSHPTHHLSYLHSCSAAVLSRGLSSLTPQA